MCIAFSFLKPGKDPSSNLVKTNIDNDLKLVFLSPPNAPLWFRSHVKPGIQGVPGLIILESSSLNDRVIIIGTIRNVEPPHFCCKYDFIV